MDIILAYIAVANLAGFFAMGADKHYAKKGMRRIPERTLFTIAIVGGSVGVYLGMRAFRHKTLHKSFRIGFPVILLCQLTLAGYLILKSKGMIP